MVTVTFTQTDALTGRTTRQTVEMSQRAARKLHNRLMELPLATWSSIDAGRDVLCKHFIRATGVVETVRLQFGNGGR